MVTGRSPAFEPGPPESGAGVVEAVILADLGFAPAETFPAPRGTATDPGGPAANLMAEGRLDPTRWWSAVADALGVAFVDDVRPETVVPTTAPPHPADLDRLRQLWLDTPEGRVLVLAPAGDALDATARAVAIDPSLASRLQIAAPASIRAAVLAGLEPGLLHRAARGLRDTRPDHSAYGTGRAGLLVPATVVAAAAALVALGGASAVALALAASQFAFAGLGALRLVAAFDPAAPGPVPALGSDLLPSYAVLVPLHREAAVVPRLLASLARLDYPADRLRLLLVVEADDAATLAAIRDHGLPRGIEVIEVPAGAPRTKPKALAYALQFVRSDLVAVFDAEDRPDPDQLRIAAAALAAGPPELACVQAALFIDHAAASRPWLARQFALEYAMLFGHLLPTLGTRGHFFPLGGTSNHFRRDALEAVGGWDPHNVTEDADIAVRLVRAGYRLATIPSRTGEEAPLTLAAWTAQRTRWMKGWLQTLLVHTRDPRRLRRELGGVDLVLVLLFLAGQLTAALIYPIGLLAVAADIALDWRLVADRTFAADLILSACLLGLCTGLAGPLLLALRVRRDTDDGISFGDILTMPLYWILLWPATIAAIFELVAAPDRWNKTRHGLAERDSPLAEQGAPALSVETRAGVAQG